MPIQQAGMVGTATPDLAFAVAGAGTWASIVSGELNDEHGASSASGR